IRLQLGHLGILNKRGMEFFTNCLVVPIHDEAGVLVNVYGRSLDPESNTPHLYLPGPLRGVFNLVGIRDAETVILTESIIDSLSLVVLGFPNTTAAYGANGFTADHRAALIRAKTKRVCCAYDADPAGDHGADQLAHDLANHGIEVLRVELACKDPNDFLKGGGTKEEFQALLDKAAVMPVSGAKASKATPTGAPSDRTSDAPAPTTDSSSFHLELVLGDRTYTVESPPVRTPLTFTVLLRVTRGERTHVDTVNLYLDRDRARFIGRAYVAFRGQVPKKVLEEDFFAVLDEAESRIQPARDEKSEAAPPPAMSEAENDEAIAFLGRPDLIAVIVDDITNLGVVGEDDTKLLVYLVATSRKLAKPLSLSVISRASAGKSWVLNRVGDLMPPEDILRYTRVSPRALFYDEPGRYKHKILFIEEAIGAKDADLGLRSMQSEKRLSNLATMTDPKTGKLRTQENVVEGPLTYLTSSVEPLDHETATRGFEVAIDESAEQTARVVARQFEERTLSGIKQRLTAEAIMCRHRNAQRLIEPLVVVNPFASKLTFPTDTLRLRREADKYLSLIDAVALLHQHQRPIKSFTHDGATHRYVEVEPGDIDIANRLMVSCLARALSDLPGPAQELLIKIRHYVMAKAEERGIDWQMVTFNRREIREAIRWSDYQVRLYLEMLAQLEYIETAGGSIGKRYVYTLSPDHQLVVQSGLSLEEKIEAMGLTPSVRLKTLTGSDLATKAPTPRRKQ
ncbi:MAG: toprim domain-containing protein, partial [Candidatus Thermoplasmatota archaeon]